MRGNMKSLRFIAALGAASLFAMPNVFAQTVPAPLANQVAPAPLDEANWRAIRVQNVRPSLLAWQLDMAHNKMPAFINVPYSPMAIHAADSKVEAPVKGPFYLPDTVRLAASDEQNLLFVTGADTQQIARLRDLVSVLDQPFRRVEIEAQFVELSAAALKQFGIEFPKTRGNTAAGAFQIGFVRNDFQQRLGALIKAGNAKVVSTQPLNIVNNNSQAVSLRSGPIDNTGVNQNKKPSAPKENGDTLITLMPTINGDDTITVLMRIETLAQNSELSGLETIFNLRDGDTIALSGASATVFPREIPMLKDIPLISRLGPAKTVEDDRVTLVFVTARILRNDEKQ